MERDRVFSVTAELATLNNVPGDTDFSLDLCELDEKSLRTDPCLVLGESKSMSIFAARFADREVLAISLGDSRCNLGGLGSL